MSKKSQTIKEITQIVVFLLVAAALLVTFVTYPLGKAKQIMARTDIDDYNPDSLSANQISLLEDTTLFVDTSRVDSDGLTSLAVAFAVSKTSRDSAAAPPSGTIILVHKESEDRDAMLPLARTFLDSGYAVVLYDQRASGRSTGKYHSDGQYEATDLDEVIAYLALRDHLPQPVMVVGLGIGADAALLASLEDSRIKAVVAVEPYLTTNRWYDLKRKASGMWWIPFRTSILSFWYEIRSSYAMEDRTSESFEPVPCKSLLIMTPNQLEDPIVRQFVEQSDNSLLQTRPLEPDSPELDNTIIGFLSSIEMGSADQP